jgi:hypothetical protein
VKHPRYPFLAASAILASIATSALQSTAAAPLKNAPPAAREIGFGDSSGHFLEELYFYPPSFSREAMPHAFDPDWIVRNATTEFPQIDEMSGVAVMLYWAQLCPAEDGCNFNIIDRILDFWAKAGKKVVLSVATIGPPIERFVSGKEFISATPEWVLNKVATFRYPSNSFFGIFPDWENMANNKQYTFPFPRYDDPRFLAEVKKLVQQLGARYDGNAVLTYVRIATGKAAEDNPIGRANGYGPGTGMPGYTNHMWTDYSRKVTELYFASFHKSRLEFDMGWMAIVAYGVKTITPSTASEQKEAREFLDYLVRRNVFIAFNGIAPQTTNAPVGTTAINPEAATCAGYDPRQPGAYMFLAELGRRGIAFGLEGNSLQSACEAPRNIGPILEQSRPQRFVFFADTAGLINFHRQGLNEVNRFAVDWATNILVPWFKGSKDDIRRNQAMPRIDQFAAELNQFVRRLVVER